MIFDKLLEQAVINGFVYPEQIYIDATHIKANANKKKYTTEEVHAAARYYLNELDEEIARDLEVHGKKPLKEFL